MDRRFKIALAISVVSHSFLFSPFYELFLISKNKYLNPIEVTYFSSAQKSIKKDVSAYSKPTNTTNKIIRQASVTKPRHNETLKKTKSIKEKKQLQQYVKKSQVKPVMDTEFKKSKNYLDYHQLLRAKIKNYVNYPKSLAQGEVHLSFTLTSDGQLKIITINEKSSSSEILLRTAALESIKKANPFPPFPANFSQDEATFNVVISFEIK